jgi:transposase
MRVFIGLDVSLAKTAICVVDHDGAVQWQGRVATEPGPLIKGLAEWSGVIELAGIEACPMSEWLHRALREAGNRSCALKRDMLSASYPLARSKPTRTMPAASQK